MNRHLKLSILLLSLTALSCASSRNMGGWILLGERTVNHALDRDEIRVGAQDGTFDRIKVTVHRRAVGFRDLKVHYANGGVEDVPLRGSIRSGGESRVIDLNGRDRVIEKIVFRYNTERRRGKQAVVRVYGRH